MRVTHQKEIDTVLKLDGPARFKHFVKRAADEERVWGLWNNGWALSAGDDGVSRFPLWPAREYAELCRLDAWAEYQPEEIPLDDLLNVLAPKLSEKGVQFSIFPTREGKTVVPTVDELCSAIRKELEKYE